jgi:heat shock protein HtpX
MFSLAILTAIRLRNIGPLGILVPILIAAIGWICRLRVPKRPKGAVEVSDLPVFQALLDSIAKSLNAPKIQLISFSPEINASVSLVSFSRIPHLTLGRPVPYLLSEDQLLALLAHEIAHLVNDDPTQGFLYGNALSTLARSGLTDPATKGLRRTPYGWMLLIPWIILRSLLSVVEWILVNTSARDSQRAEYRADLLAAELAGPESVVGLFENMAQDDLVAYACRKAGIQNLPIRPILRELVDSRPERETLRLSRLARTENLWPTDTTHPPTELRIELLEAKFGSMPRKFNAYDHESVLRELQPFLL